MQTGHKAVTKAGKKIGGGADTLVYNDVPLRRLCGRGRLSRRICTTMKIGWWTVRAALERAQGLSDLRKQA